MNGITSVFKDTDGNIKLVAATTGDVTSFAPREQDFLRVLIKIAVGRTDCGRSHNREVMREMAREALAKNGVPWSREIAEAIG